MIQLILVLEIRNRKKWRKINYQRWWEFLRFKMCLLRKKRKNEEFSEYSELNYIPSKDMFKSELPALMKVTLFGNRVSIYTQVKMRSYCIKVNLNPMTHFTLSRGTFWHRHIRTMQCDNRSNVLSDPAQAKEHQELLAILRSWGEAMNETSLETAKGAWPVDTLISDFWYLKLWENKLLLF